MNALRQSVREVAGTTREHLYTVRVTLGSWTDLDWVLNSDSAHLGGQQTWRCYSSSGLYNGEMACPTQNSFIHHQPKSDFLYFNNDSVYLEIKTLDMIIF